MNELPIMPIRAKYADETAKGVNIDEAIEGAAGDIDAVEGRVETLETTVGDSSAGLVKKVTDLEDKTQKINYNEGDNTTEISGGFDVEGTVSADAVSSPSGAFTELNGETDPSVKPLYWHGINIQSPLVLGSYKYQLTLVIINNDSTPYATWADLKAKIISFGNTAFINLNGYYNQEGEGVLNAIFLYRSGQRFYLVGNDSSCQRITIDKPDDGFDDIFGGVGAVVEDRVNKLN